MSLYTCIKDDKGELIVLNEKYKNKEEQIREKLQSAEYAPSEVDNILATGSYLDQPIVKKVYAKENRAYLTTQEVWNIVTFETTQTIVVYPDGRWRNATFLEKLTEKVNDGMWGSVVCAWITFGNGEAMTFFSNEYEKAEIEEQLLQRKYSKEIVNAIMRAGRYRDYPRLVELSVNGGTIEQELEGDKSRTGVFTRKRWIVVYPNAFWRFATLKEVMSGTALG